MTAGLVLLLGVAALACSPAEEGSSRGSDASVTPSGEVDRNLTLPEVEGPVDGAPANAMPADLADEHGYVEEELFLSGDAASYVGGDLPSDGAVEAVATAAD